MDSLNNPLRQCGGHYYPHFVDEETKSQRVRVAFSRAHGHETSELGLYHSVIPDIVL